MIIIIYVFQTEVAGGRYYCPTTHSERGAETNESKTTLQCVKGHRKDTMCSQSDLLQTWDSVGILPRGGDI